MKDKLSVLIPDGDDGNIPLTVLRCLSQAPDIKVSVLSREQWPPIRFSKHKQNFFVHDVDAFNRKRVDAILHAAKQAKADIILPVEEATIRLMAEYSEEVRSIIALPPLPTPELMDIVPDKWLFGELLEKENIPHPSTILCQNNKEYQQNIASLKFPVLVKPRVGFGGTGILFFNSYSKLMEYSKNQEYPENFIIQEFIHGNDITCSVLCKNGEILAYTIQRGIIPGKKRFAPAAGIEFIYQEQVFKDIQNLIRTINWSGIACFDLRYNEEKKQPEILEMNPRYWGSLVGSLVAGINFPYLACLTGMNVDFPKPDYRFIRYSRVGINLSENPLVGLFVKKSIKKENRIYKYSTTGLPFLLRDPLPELQKELVIISNKIFRKEKSRI